MVWQKNGLPDTLTSDGDVLDIDPLSAVKYNQFLYYTPITGTNLSNVLTLDNITTQSYSFRSQFNGAVPDGISGIDQTELRGGQGGSTGDVFGVWNFMNIDGEEKVGLGFVLSNVTGASNAPNRDEIAGKFIQTSQYTRVTVTNSFVGGDFETGSNLSALGDN